MPYLQRDLCCYMSMNKLLYAPSPDSSPGRVHALKERRGHCVIGRTPNSHVTREFYSIYPTSHPITAVSQDLQSFNALSDMTNIYHIHHLLSHPVPSMRIMRAREGWFFVAKAFLAPTNLYTVFRRQDFPLQSVDGGCQFSSSNLTGSSVPSARMSVIARECSRCWRCSLLLMLLSICMGSWDGL